MKKNFLKFLIPLLLWSSISMAGGKAYVSSSNQTAFPIAGAQSDGTMAVLQVDSDGVLQVSLSGGSSFHFTDLTDVPSSYSGQAGNFLRVNSAETGLEFATVSGLGDVVGPSSATDNALVRFDSTTGKLVKNSVGILNNTGDLTGINSLEVNQTTNNYGLQIDSAATTVGALRFNTTLQTSASIITIPNADSLDSGAVMNVVSDSPSPTPRKLFFFRNKNILATHAVPFWMEQDSEASGMVVDRPNTNSPNGALVINDSNTGVGASININMTGTSKLLDLKKSGTSKLTLDQNELDIQTGIIFKNVTTATNYTALTNDYMILVTSTAATRTISLPAVAGVTDGKTYIIKDASCAVGTNGTSIVIDPNGAELIDNATTAIINHDCESRNIMKNGSSWYIF